MPSNERFTEVLTEKNRRASELMRIYRPSKFQDPIHRSQSSEIIVRGGKRAGKSVSVSAEFASRVTGVPIIGPDGKPIKSRWAPPSPDYPRLYWIIGWDTKHIGQTVHRLLFQRGQGGSYRVIQDLKTGLWRAWNRADKIDQDRIEESKLAEPLIPERLIEPDSWEWEDKKANHFNSVRLKNGARIFAYPSSARNPKQGDAVTGIWIDEDIQFPEHLKEWQDRLTDESGWLMWSVWPHMKNEALLELLNRAQLAELDPNPRIQSFQLVMTDNPYIPEQGKQDALGRMGSDEEIKRRNRGELLTDALSMYQFSSSMHQIQRPIKGQVSLYELPPAHELLRDIWVANGAFPREWTRYLSIDPSNTRTAVHSWVVPPPEHRGILLGDIAIAEWELVARRYSAKVLAGALADMMGSNRYEAFIMDQQIGRQTNAGREENTFQVYSSAFKDKRLTSRLTGYSFIPGCNLPQVRYHAVRSMLVPSDETRVPQIMVVEETNPETRKEFDRYRKKSEARGVSVDAILDEPQNPRLFDCMASVEYFAAYIENMFVAGQAYVEPSLYAGRGSPAYRAAKDMLKKRNKTDEAGVVYMGAGGYS